MQVPERNSVTAETGNAIVEFVVVLPFLLFLFGALLDFGNALITHRHLSAIAEEGARVAASVTSHEANILCVSGNDLDYCSGQNAPNAQTPHEVMWYLLEQLTLDLDWQTIKTTSKLTIDAPPVVSGLNETVEVHVRGRHRSVVGLNFADIPFDVHVTSKYLRQTNGPILGP